MESPGLVRCLGASGRYPIAAMAEISSRRDLSFLPPFLQDFTPLSSALSRTTGLSLVDRRRSTNTAASTELLGCGPVACDPAAGNRHAADREASHRDDVDALGQAGSGASMGGDSRWQPGLGRCVHHVPSSAAEAVGALMARCACRFRTGWRRPTRVWPRYTGLYAGPWGSVRDLGDTVAAMTGSSLSDTTKRGRGTRSMPLPRPSMLPRPATLTDASCLRMPDQLILASRAHWLRRLAYESLIRARASCISQTHDKPRAWARKQSRAAARGHACQAGSIAGQATTRHPQT
ncbi:hypothetical protein CDD83_2631 [Cordyceps sp. RAO-2017]|nr:hypothetical protein CDD83_2631 [Cordyceps sp. RAO-2017]